MYTFTGKVKQRMIIHSANNNTKVETYYYNYGTPSTNPAERLLDIKYKLSPSTTQTTLAVYTYDDVGRVKTRKLGTETSTYHYNVRSWLTQIAGTKFNQTLAYNAAVNGITPAKALYNGNISAMKWKAGDEATERGYKFTYDGLDRLTAVTYGEGAAVISNPDRFNEALSYDKMGNITALQRRGKLDSGYGVMDNLTYSYTGNKLTKVTDAVTAPITYPGAFHFVDGANVADEYAYDANGNLTKDLNKNITSITYNALNLPSVITFADGNTISYGYDATGSKLSVAYSAGGSTVKTEYVGNKVYRNGTLNMILTQEGYLTLAGTTPTYYYYLKDHKGNNRVVLSQSGTVEQVNYYYPFGGLFGEGLQTSNQPYRYNGKELDRFQNLDMYDYGARHYNASLGRWFTVDPMAEKYYSISSYAYVANNPVRFIDLRGDSISLAKIQQLDQTINTSYTQTIINDLQFQTGLTIAVSTDEKMSYAKDTNGQPIIATTIDANGNAIQTGSIAVRSLMIGAVDHQNWVNVVPAGKSGVPPGTNELRLGINQINKFINGAVNLDNRTLGWGMTFMHELHHTQIGGGLKDSPGNPGPVVGQMNIIRSELNVLGGNYG